MDSLNIYLLNQYLHYLHVAVFISVPVLPKCFNTAITYKINQNVKNMKIFECCITVIVSENNTKQ